MVSSLRRHAARLLVLLVATTLALGCGLIPGQVLPDSRGPLRRQPYLADLAIPHGNLP